MTDTVDSTHGSGLLQLGARTYWPEIGRFLQQDPTGTGMNWYAYVGDNPVVWADLSGRRVRVVHPPLREDVRTSGMSAFERVSDLAQQFARRKGRRAVKRMSFSGPYVGIQWRDGWVTKVIMVTPRGEWASVNVHAQATRFAPWWRLPFLRHPEWVYREVGAIDDLDSEGHEALERALEDAWRWLRNLDLAAVVAGHTARAAHVTQSILPVVQQFAAGCGGRVAEATAYEARVEWPAPDAKFRLELYYSDRSGFSVAGLRREPGEPSERGWVLYERMLADLRLPDWNDTAGLSALLQEAKRRLEEGGTSGSGMTQLPPARL